MKQSIKWILGTLSLIALIALASALYGQLSDTFVPDSMVELPPTDVLLEGQEEPAESTPPATSTDQSAMNEAEEPEKSEEAGESDETKQHVEMSVPNFSVVDAQGNEYQLSDFIGQPIVLNFWASWCGYCVMEMPDFNQAYHDNPDVVFMMINVTDGQHETMEKALAFVAQNEFDFPVYYDTQLFASSSYGASALPMTFFIQKNGSLGAYARGMIDAQTLAKGIAKITE